ncbi:RNA degradosome polyphosphate kinase [Candidatus Formimonas warabiya]|uniref:Polyphosphate kinase n=1 Tax=Formimonas warabiya TaxID=1761012 RepID=A0A3G1KV20_FORW1|nr:RNA degradosome polyphosphate kinase [Candidatus Formimonas warabiya]ATW26299.1 RNA degradosome polyphosphate kinase [Candidatus Formimonas warabiya]
MHKENSNFFNRELSWIEFNKRVLEEAQGRRHPLLERLKFASIVSSNFDEFYMIRVASLQDQVLAGFREPDGSGMTPAQQLEAISGMVHETVEVLYQCFNESLVPALKKEGIHLLRAPDLTAEQKANLAQFYQKTVYPVLTPLVVDQSRPFPLINNRSLNIALLLSNDEEEGEPLFATVQVPSVLGRLVQVPVSEGRKSFVFLEDVIKLFLPTLFSGHQILAAGCFRVTRNADLDMEEEGAEDLLDTIKESLRKRKWGGVIRLEIEKEMDANLVHMLKEQLEVPSEGIFPLNHPLDLTFLMNLYGLEGFEHLKQRPLQPQIPPFFQQGGELFKAIGESDLLVHHPYESFDPVVEMVKQAANDPHVLAIKQTLYRVSGNSPLVNALAEAAENGKQVTVLVELKARFDEENNILWAKRLEQAGCHVIYGIKGLKTHGKLLLVVRMEEDGIKRYMHMGTGNYNDFTAKLYEDLGFFTANPCFGADASILFNLISGYSELTDMYKLSVAPFNLRQRFIQLIRQEAEYARQGKPARILAKLNSLVDGEIISELYAASQAGVEINLIVRGICCLRPGIAGLSENISVRSIVGRFLEHSRIYLFHNNQKEIILLSSADLMPRNLDRRLEILFPIEDEQLKSRVKKILETYLQDNVNARILNPDGSYRRVEKRGRRALDCQDYFRRMAVHRSQDMDDEEIEKILTVYAPKDKENLA